MKAMHPRTKRHPLPGLLLALTLLINLSSACSSLSADDTEKANRLIAEANTAIDAGNVSAVAASKKNDWIFQEIRDTTFADDKVRLKAAITETIDGFNQGAAKFREAARKFEEASRLRINDKFKEYLALKSQEFNRNAEKMEAAAAIPQAVLDSDTIETLKQKFDENKTRYEQLEKEAKDLADRADKVRAENKDQFQPENANK
jgi:FtsZ-binding cell division protein ZapB